ncbi:MAG: hypothetical protein KDA17_02440 [Candidatus Saccharibacteria bacterium]|nr:hypothetical protein [Candidatus Saccharibacteria bacterium]
MAKEIITKEVTEEVATPPTATTENIIRTDTTSINRSLIIAVGAAVVLFIIGMVLGYLLGRVTSGSDHGTMMDGHYRRFDPDTGGRLRQSQATGTQSSSSTSTQAQ